MYNIIAETAFSHEGDFNYLKSQVDAASKSGVNIIKFQVLLKAENYMVDNHPAFNVIKNWEFTKKQWLEIFEYSIEKGLKILALPLTKESLLFCMEHEDKMSLYEIHSVCFNDFNLIDEIKNTKKKIVLGIGGRTADEIEEIIKKMEKSEEEIILMLGFQSFPTQKEKLNLKKIQSLSEKFKSPLGYADHCSYQSKDYLLLNSLALAWNTKYFEKHIVVEKGVKRTDYEAGIDFNDFLEMKERLDIDLLLFGDGDLNHLNDKEKTYASREKSLVFSREMNKNEVVNKESLTFKISNTNYFNLEVNDVLGKKLIKNVGEGEIVETKLFN